MTIVSDRTRQQEGSPLSRDDKAEDRRARIVRLLEASNGVPVRTSVLVDEVGASVATLRRDLTVLEEQGRVSRTYGGAVAMPSRRAREMGRRERNASDEKKAIARAAVELLHDGDLVILDAGSTAEQVAVEIGEARELTVVTNGIRAINRLSMRDNVQVMVLGGYLRGTNGTICGGEAEAMLERVRGDVAFVGAVRVSPRRGIASLTYDQARLKSLMMQQARQVCVIADSTKFSADDDYPYWSPMPAHWSLITDVAVDPRHLDSLRSQGADPVILVDPADEAAPA